MRNGDPAADPGSAEPLAFVQHVVDTALGDTRGQRGATRNLLQGLLLVADPQLGDHVARCQQLGDLDHDSLPDPSNIGRPACTLHALGPAAEDGSIGSCR